MVVLGPPSSEPSPDDSLTGIDVFQCWGVADDGAVVEVSAHGSFADLVAEQWPPLGLTRSDSPRERVQRRIAIEAATDDGRPTVSVDGSSSWGGWERVESDLAIFAAERLAGLVAVHAAVILHGTSALLVPGSSGNGKSTLCVAAHGVGAKVLTDEYALINPSTGCVTGWRRSVRMRRPGGVDRLDLAVASDPVPVGLIALVKHDPHAGRAWVPISGAEAVLGILANTVCAQSRPDEALDAALAVARSAPAVAGTREDAEPAIVGLLDLIDDHR